MKANDVLLLVGSVPVTGNGVAAAAQALRGKGGSDVSITVRTGDAVQRVITLTRTEVSDDAVTVERLSGGVLRIRVGTFTSGRRPRGPAGSQGGARDPSVRGHPGPA